MFQYCKLCHSIIRRQRRIFIGHWVYEFNCLSCKKYSLLFDDEKLEISSEKILVGNFFLYYYWKSQFGIVWQIDDGKERPICRIKVGKLTNEMAVHWVDKLKKYVIFQ